jgi:diguanylate cyclase (GGDEF)-like protein/PAS domain S-box-containing protein
MASIKNLVSRFANTNDPGPPSAHIDIVEAAQLVLGRTANAALVTDRTGAVVYMNPAAEALTGRTLEEVGALNMNDLLRLTTLDSGKHMEIPLAGVIAGARTVELPNYAVAKSAAGRIVAVQGSVAPLLSSTNRILGTVVQLFDVSRLGTIPEQLNDPARIDELTGLTNRREFESRVTRAISRVQQHKQPCVLACINVDGFRRITETFGTAFGEEVLESVALVLRSRVRERDTLARLRGDEFGMLLEGCSVPVGVRIAEDVLKGINLLRFEAEGETVQIKVSIGVTALTEDCPEAAVALNQADAGRHLAKLEGGNRIAIYGPVDEEDEDSALGTDPGALSAAIQEDRFRFFLQPIVALKPGGEDIEHYEVLTKLEKSDGELVGPAYFISDAERHHFMPVLERHIIRRAFEEYNRVAATRSAGRPMVWSINLSGLSLRQGGLIEFIRVQAEACDVPLNRICFEITESAALTTLRQGAEFIRALKSSGFLVSLDDFGPAMGAIGSLSGLSIDFVKIDGAYVKQVAQGQIGRRTVKAIQYLCNTLGFKTIAEAVEDDETLSTLAQIGVNYVQGYRVGRPVPVDALVPNNRG